jgi:hypothetical protein
VRRNVEVVSCDFCGENIEGMLVTGEVRTINCGERKYTPVRLYKQIFFNYDGTKYVYDICSKCEDKLANGEISISTDICVNRSFTNG